MTRTQVCYSVQDSFHISRVLARRCQPQWCLAGDNCDLSEDPNPESRYSFSEAECEAGDSRSHGKGMAGSSGLTETPFPSFPLQTLGGDGVLKHLSGCLGCRYIISAAHFCVSPLRQSSIWQELSHSPLSQRLAQGHGAETQCLLATKTLLQFKLCQPHSLFSEGFPRG